MEAIRGALKSDRETAPSTTGDYYASVPVNNCITRERRVLNVLYKELAWNKNAWVFEGSV